MPSDDLPPDVYRTLADAYHRGELPLPSSYRPPPPRPPRNDTKLWAGAAIGLLLFGGLALFNADAPPLQTLGIVEPPPPPPPPPSFSAYVECTHSKPELNRDYVGSALRLLTEDRVVTAEVRVRNLGGPGVGTVVVEMTQSHGQLVVSKEERIALEERGQETLTFQFPEYADGAQYECDAWGEGYAPRLPAAAYR